VLENLFITPCCGITKSAVALLHPTIEEVDVFFPAAEANSLFPRSCENGGKHAYRPAWKICYWQLVLRRQRYQAILCPASKHAT